MSTGQALGGVVGGVIGAVVGGPTGAIYGAQIGIMAGGLLDPPKGPTVEGPRLSDLSVQTSTYGQFIPRTYGTIGLSGNVFWLENNQIKEVVKKKKSGGKGGGSSSTVKTYSYFATFAVGLCEGPIAGVRRIWVGPDLVYDAGSDDLETIISSNHASAKFTIYTGTDTQQPDPRMQAEMGVANCPAFRGLAYIVVKDLLLTNYGNSVAGAQVKAEVVKIASISEPLVILSPGILDADERITFSGGGLTQTATYLQGVFTASDYIASIKFKDFETVTGQLIREYVMQMSMPRLGVSASTGNMSHGYIIGKKNSFFATRNIGSSKAILFNDSSTEIRITGLSAPDDSSGSSRRYTFANGSYWLPSATSIFQIRGANVTEWPDASITTITSVIFADAVTGYMYIRYKPASSGGTYISRFIDNPALRAWDSQVSTSNVANTFSFSVDGGRICVHSDGTVKVYDITDTGLVLAGSISSALINSEVYYIDSGISNSSDDYIQTSKSLIPINATLASIFSEEAKRSTLIKPSDIDVTGLSDSVTGFKVTATGSIRNAIEPLRGAWPFDVVQAGYKIKATSRGSASVVNIPIGELAIDTQLTESREMDSQLPQNVTVKYIDRDRNYDQNEQRAQRDNTEAVNSLVLELPVVLSATQSAQVADKLIRIYALEKSDFSFTLPAPYRYLEPGDVATIAADDADYVLRLVSVNQTADGRLECAGRPSSAATYTSIAPGDGGQQGTVTIPLAGATIGLIVDCPVIDEGLQDASGFAVGMNGYSVGWPGGILYRTADGGQTWDDLQALQGRATAGYAAGVLSASAGNLIQRGGSLTVSLIGGTLESVTEAQMLNGANIAAYGANGRWEILRFQNATLNGDGTYTLDTFWRGDKGTEWATSLHAANDLFVLMTDPDLAFVGMPTDSIGQPRDYRSVTASADIDSASDQPFTYSAVNLETLSGVHPRGSRSAGDLTITWQRRTRVGGAWRDYVDASLGETAESYEVDIMDGATVKRTITATTPSVLYTSAMQVTDFGSPQASVTVNIYQLSAVVGRGYKLEATL